MDVRLQIISEARGSRKTPRRFRLSSDRHNPSHAISSQPRRAWKEDRTRKHRERRRSPHTDRRDRQTHRGGRRRHNRMQTGEKIEKETGRGKAESGRCERRIQTLQKASGTTCLRRQTWKLSPLWFPWQKAYRILGLLQIKLCGKQKFTILFNLHSSTQCSGLLKHECNQHKQKVNVGLWISYVRVNVTKRPTALYCKLIDQQG